MKIKLSKLRRVIREQLQADISLSSHSPQDLRSKLDAFMAEYRSISERNPLNPRIQYWYMGKVDDEDCLVLTDLNIFDGAISFNTIQTVPRDTYEKKGFASKVMNQIAALADKHQVPMTLDAVPFGQKSLGEKELESWYRRAGFDREDEYEELRREPK